MFVAAGLPLERTCTEMKKDHTGHGTHPRLQEGPAQGHGHAVAQVFPGDRDQRALSKREAHISRPCENNAVDLLRFALLAISQVDTQKDE